MDRLISRMDQHKDIFEKIMGDEQVGALIREMMMRNLYRRFNE